MFIVEQGIKWKYSLVTFSMLCLVSHVEKID